MLIASRLRACIYFFAAAVLCSVLASSSALAQLSGSVVLTDLTPVGSALVSVQATGVSTTTAADGTFWLGDATGSGLTVVAAKKGYYNVSVTASVPDSGIVIVLEPVPQHDDPNYTLVDPQVCGGCHPTQYGEWQGSPMARAGVNTWVEDIYSGTGTPGGMGGFVYLRDSIFAGHNPNSECASCHQPEPWLDEPFRALLSINDPSPGVAHGVSCDVCHKFADIDESKLNHPGLYPGTVTFTRPAGPVVDQVQYGMLGDTDYNIPSQMRGSYQPQLGAEVCGACHQDKNDPDEDGNFDEPNGVVSEPTYFEWKNSAYADEQSPLYADCVDCHMPPSGTDSACSVISLTRDPNTIRSHEIRGTTAEYLENAAELSIDTQITGDTLEVTVAVTNAHTGHHVPTGVTVRNMILLVEAWRDGDGLPLVHTGVQEIHDLGGIGDPAQGYYAGLPGKFYAKLNHDASGNGPTFFTDATGIQFDTRIPALETDVTDYSFDVPAGGGALSVRARLIYRRAFRFLVDAKQWTEDGQGNPLPDIAGPDYGYLMEMSERTILAVSCDGQPAGTSCADGNPCNGDEVCNGIGDCQPGVATDCTQLDDECNIGVCDTDTGSCVIVSDVDGSPCDDGTFCNGNDLCQAGVCDFHLGDPCTGQLCDEAVDSCVECLGNADCDDVVSCTTDSCIAGSCDFSDDCPAGQACNALTDVCQSIASDPDNDGLEDTADPCPFDPRNHCFGPVALDSFTAKPLRINTNASSTVECAGDKIDCSGDLWVGDHGFNQTSKANVCNIGGGGESCVISGITTLFGCEDEETEDIFQCSHSDPTPDPDLAWNLNVDDGTYLVNLFFANTYDGTTLVGDRVLDISFEGSVYYSAFDQVAAAGGSEIAVVRSAIVTVSDGNGLDIEFGRVQDSPSVQAIEVLGSDASTCATTLVCPDHATCNAETGICDVKPDFATEAVATALDRPTSLEFLPDGRVIVLEKDGHLVIVDPTVTPATVAPYMLVPNVLNTSEAGMLDIVLDPDFETNGFFYLYFAWNGNNTHRVSRFTHLGDTGDPTSAVLIWEDDQPFEKCCHYGGGLDFGPDGKLYLSLGEKYFPERAQDMTLAGGKVIRINPDGSIPLDNPFVDNACDVSGGPCMSAADCGAGETCVLGPNYDAIWALGLRNPWRAYWDEPTGRYFIGDFGLDTYETLNLGEAGANYGWPMCEGDCNQPATLVDPIFTYQHVGGGFGIVGGGVYHGLAFPVGMHGAFFYGDYVAGMISYLTFDVTGTIVMGNFKLTDEAGAVVALDIGPDGAIYWVDHISGELRRMTFDDGNLAPVITQASADPLSGPQGTTVTFTGDADDNENDPLTYHWTFGDGGEDFGKIVAHEYTTSGPYSAQLAVSDASHTVASDPIPIMIGNPPIASITLPIDASLFSAGDTIAYAGNGTDLDETLGTDAFEWVIELKHGDVTQLQFGPSPGMSGSFDAPATGYPYGGSARFRVTLTVTDSDGLTDSTYVEILPDLVTVTMDTSPTGLNVVLGGSTVATPFVFQEAKGFIVGLDAPSPQCASEVEQTWSAWSDAGAQAHDVTVPNTDVSYTATFLGGGQCATPGDLDNDGLLDLSDPCPNDPRNLCFGPVARDRTLATDMRINAHSAAAVCSGSKTDCNGDVWVGDFGYNVGSNNAECNLNGGGDLCVVSGLDAIFGCDGSAASTQDLFQCEHFDKASVPNLIYDFDVADGRYLVNLFFANTFDGTTQPGDRVFDIQIEGATTYAGFDQVAIAGGSGVGVVRSALIDVVDSNGLQIELLHMGTGDPAIKAIEVLEEQGLACTTNTDCDDTNACTQDLCTANTCGNDPGPFEGAGCDDANPCTTTDVCSAGNCTGSGDPCPGQLCDEVSGACLPIPGGNGLIGGLLYDKWWLINGAPEPTGDHPLYPVGALMSGSTTYRCKECHGWDYKGLDGAYSSGSHFTGIIGVHGSLLTPSEMFELIKSDAIPNGHGFANFGLMDEDIVDLVQFLQDRTIDTAAFIDPIGLFLGDDVSGEAMYLSAGPGAPCVTCHGLDGTALNFGTPEAPDWLGTHAVENPWEVLHKIRFGNPGTFMPGWLSAGGLDQESADIGRYIQLNFPIECMDAGHCDDGNVCTVDTCVAGLCDHDGVPQEGVACDDGFFCSTVSACAAGVCTGSGDACPGAFCDEIGDVCVDCLVDADCANGAFCDGAETCQAAMCVGGSDPCPGQTCDESNDLCIPCSSNGDCFDDVACTDDLCTAGACSNPDNCPLFEGCNVVTESCEIVSGDPDNDGLGDGNDPCPDDPRNLCFGSVAVDQTAAIDIRINAHAESATCSGTRVDCNGDVWTADFGYNRDNDNAECNLGGGGELCVITGIATIFGCDSDDTEDLFQCEHFDKSALPELIYDFDVPNGQYLINFLFANTFTGTDQPGERAFDIAAESALVYDDFDQVAAAGGSGVAVVRSAIVNVTDGDGLQIEFLHDIAGDPSLKALEVLSGASSPVCTTNGDCDDFAFCNGAEICSAGNCLAGSAPCTAQEVCDETGDTCDTCASVTIANSVQCYTSRTCLVPLNLATNGLAIADITSTITATSTITCGDTCSTGPASSNGTCTSDAPNCGFDVSDTVTPIEAFGDGEIAELTIECTQEAASQQLCLNGTALALTDTSGAPSCSDDCVNFDCNTCMSGDCNQNAILDAADPLCAVLCTIGQGPAGADCVCAADCNCLLGTEASDPICSVLRQLGLFAPDTCSGAAGGALGYGDPTAMASTSPPGPQVVVSAPTVGDKGRAAYDVRLRDAGATVTGGLQVTLRSNDRVGRVKISRRLRGRGFSMHVSRASHDEATALILPPLVHGQIAPMNRGIALRVKLPNVSQELSVTDIELGSVEGLPLQQSGMTRRTATRTHGRKRGAGN